jgi:hypothetical protein
VLSHGEKGIKYHDVNTIVIPNFYYTWNKKGEKNRYVNSVM